jgi:hypothetical protein
VRLASRRVTNQVEVQKLFAEIENMWNEAREEYNRLKKAGTLKFSLIFRVEHNIRKNFLGMVWWTTKPFGNSEFKRVYNWRQGFIGPLNGLLNYMGAQLRNLASKYYVFPQPTYYQVREYADGRKEVLHRSTAMKYPAKDTIKSYWISVYSGNSKYPSVRVRHSTLPELDFVDMIRAHLIELVRQCFIYNVPRTASQRYIRLLIYRLKPFLDWIYTGGEYGRKNFWPEADRELREIVLELRARYGKRVGRIQRMTQQSDGKGDDKDKGKEEKKEAKKKKSIFGEQADEALKRDSSNEMKKAVATLRKLVKENKLDDTDEEIFKEQILTITQKEGNDWHRILFSDKFQPRSLKQAIFAGDQYATETSDILVAAEVPVLSSLGGGKADLVIFVRRKVGDSLIWVPVMVLDVKTKTGIKWSVLGKRPRTEKSETRVPYFDIRKRLLTDNEWNAVIKGTPEEDESDQIDIYEQAIVDEYKRIMEYDSSAPKKLWKGIIVLDPDQDKEQMFQLLPWLIKSTVEHLRVNKSTKSKRTLFTPNFKGRNKKEQPKLGIVLTSDSGPYKLLKGTVSLTSLSKENPFKSRIKDNRQFTLYLTVASGGSSGESAAWIARNWHLLHHLIDLKNTHRKPVEIVWLDLLGTFSTKGLIAQRLRLFGTQKPKRVSRSHIASLRALVDEIGFQDMSGEIAEYYFENAESGQKHLISCLKKLFKKRPKKNRIVVVDGWATLRSIIPPHLNTLTNVLESKLLEWLPEKDVEILWLDRLVPHPLMSSVYQRMKVTPLPHDSPRERLLDEIIWNLPSSPRNFGWVTPRREDIRIIAQDLPTNTPLHVIPFGVPHLKGWARRFRAETNEDHTVSLEEVVESIVGDRYARLSGSSSRYTEVGDESKESMLSDIYDLVPSLCRSRGDTQKEDSDENPNESKVRDIILTTKQLASRPTSKGRFRLVQFVPYEERPRQGRPGEYSPPNKISRGWIHKTEFKEEKPIKRTTHRPPVVQDTSLEHIDTEKTRFQEVLRIKRTAEFLIYKSNWQRIMECIVSICNKCIRSKGGTSKPLDILCEVRDFLTTAEKSRKIWQLLLYKRRQFMYDTQLVIYPALKELNKRKADIMTLYGNALFLLVLGIYWRGYRVYFQEWTDHMETLWDAISDWQLLHMGFHPRDSDEVIVESLFDVSAIWSNLLWRAKQLAARSTGIIPIESYKIGALVPCEESNYSWLVFQEYAGSERMLAGLFENPHDRNIQHKRYDGVVNLETLRNFAEKWQLSDYRRVIALAKHGDMELLLRQQIEDDDTIQWDYSYQIKYGLPSGNRSFPIKWFNFKGIPRSIWPLLGKPEVRIPNDLMVHVDRTLQEINEFESEVMGVKVEVSLNEKKQSYEIRLVDKPGQIRGLEYEIFFFNTTQELVEFLRMPFQTKQFFETQNGFKYSWDPRRDVFYVEAYVKSDVLSTSFLKPLVNRRSFLKGKYKVPENAVEVLNSVVGEELLLVAYPDIEKYRQKQKHCWNIWLIINHVGPRLKSIEKLMMNIEDVALLFECEQIFDVDTGLRHSTKVAINDFKSIIFPIDVFHYPRIGSFLRNRGLGEDLDVHEME